MIDRRLLLATAAGGLAWAAYRWLPGGQASAAGKFEIEKSDAEWRSILTPAQYDVLRKHGTEPRVLHANFDGRGARHVSEARDEAREGVAKHEAKRMRRDHRRHQRQSGVEHCVFLRAENRSNDRGDHQDCGGGSRWENPLR